MAKTRVYARCCSLVYDRFVISQFYAKNHRLGTHGPSDFSVALSYKGEIVSAMTFRKVKGVINNVRYCNSQVEVLGGFDRLMKEAVRFYGGGKLITYCDRDLTPEPNKSVYFRKGWKLASKVAPLLTYWKREVGTVPRERLMKSKLRAFFKDVSEEEFQKSTEQEICIRRGYLPCYNSGAWKFEIEYK